MGQYRPSGLTPSTLTSTYSIDATIDNDFSCQLNGNSPTTAYRLIIMENTTSSTVVYDTGIVSLSTPIYPIDYNGEQSSLIVTVPSTSTMVNGDSYKWTISSYWSVSDYLTSYENVFYAYSSPVLSIDTYSSTITDKSYTFTATCTQAEDVVVEKFGWILKEHDSGYELINTIDLNNIYSGDIKLYYNGFFTGTDYDISVKCWLANGVEIQTVFETFSVVYDLIAVNSYVNTTQTSDTGVFVEWGEVKYISGIAYNSDYSYIEKDIVNSNTIIIDSGNYIYFDEENGVPLSINSNSTHVISFYVDSDSNVKSIYKAEGIIGESTPFYIELIYQEDVLSLDVNGSSTAIYVTSSSDSWFVISISPSYINLFVFSGQSDGLYPSDILYPSETLYPSAQSYAIVSDYISVPIEIPEVIYNKVTLSGPDEVNYLWIVSGELTQEEINYFNNITYEPVWDNKTLLLATFNNTLNAGNVYSDSSVLYWDIYRRKSDESHISFIAELDNTITSITDYVIANQTYYYYYVFPVFIDKIGAAISSNIFYSYWWDWSLIVCDNTSISNMYYMNNVYLFDLNVSSAQMNNNTSFSVLENFTQYAKIQSSNSNYWTGTLSALIGNCNSYTDSDTINKMNSLKLLSTDGKVKFLKDRKGNVWKVKINSPINQQISDEFKEQQVTITLSWMEIGSVENNIIINNIE